MDFGIIFLCLLIGAVIGFEAGKIMTSNKIRKAISDVTEGLNKIAEENKKKREKELEERREILAKNIDKLFENIQKNQDKENKQ